jgi:opacity protein-like surface antigen
MFKKIALAAALVLAATSASATDTRSYAGVDVGRSSIDDYDKNYTSFGAFGGYRFSDAIAVEGALRRLGSDDGAKADQLAVSAVFTGYAKGEWSQISLFGRLGVNRVNFSKCGVFCPKDETSVLLGAGIGYDINPRTTVRLEYTRPTSDTSNVSLGLAFGF